MKKQLMSTVLALVMLVSIAACKSAEQQKVKENTQITMYLWDKSVDKKLTPWLEKQFPDVDFTFIVGYNTIDYYSDLSRHDALPDIFTCRRFSLNDAVHIADQLMDMSQTELVGTFYNSYIENNRDTSGAIKWLPMCAEIDGIIANKDVFDAYNVPLPNNYGEFVEACRIFEENGVVGFLNDYSEDYSCMEAMQGCAIPELMSLEGTSWRAEYESETESGQVGLDDKVWPVVFEKFEQFLKDTWVEAEDAERSFNDAKTTFVEKQAAMIRGTGNDCVVLSVENGFNCLMLPYFGETEEDNWLLTYPIYQVAVNKDVEKDPVKKAVVMKVLDAIFSNEGQAMAATGSTVLTYNKTVDITLHESLAPVQDCIKRNHLYQRLASTEIFSISKDVAHKMIRGEYGAQGAYEDFNAQITASPVTEEPEIVATMNTGYDYAFTDRGNPAVSAVMNTLRKQVGGDVLIGYSSLITAPVFAGNYSARQISWLVNNRSALRRAQLTGAQILKVMDWLVNVKEDGSNPIRHKNLIPAVSGMEYTVTDNGDGTFTLDNVTMNGEQLDESTVYTVLLLGDDNYIEASFFYNCPMPQEIKDALKNVEGNAAEHLIAALTDGKQLEAPTDYVTIRS